LGGEFASNKDNMDRKFFGRKEKGTFWPCGGKIGGRARALSQERGTLRENGCRAGSKAGFWVREGGGWLVGGKVGKLGRGIGELTVAVLLGNGGGGGTREKKEDRKGKENSEGIVSESESASRIFLLGEGMDITRAILMRGGKRKLDRKRMKSGESNKLDRAGGGVSSGKKGGQPCPILNLGKGRKRGEEKKRRGPYQKKVKMIGKGGILRRGGGGA